MAKIRLTLRPFRRLQWRLTFSYTLVTVGALLVVEIILLGAAMLLLNSNVIAEEIVRAIDDDLTLSASLYLDKSPPDGEGLNQWLELVVNDSVAVSREGTRLTRGLSITFDQDYQIFVIDEEGMLIAQAMDGSGPQPLGSAFDTSSIEGLAPLYAAVQVGTSDPDQLHVTNPDGTLVMALPIEDNRSNLLGTLIVSMLMPTFNLQSLRSFAVLILLSAVPITLAAGIIGSLFGFLTARGLTRRIESLSNTADSWSHGDFSIMSADKSADELGHLSQNLNLMAEQLQNLMHTNQVLASSEERNRLARDLHDSVKQQVFATTMQLGAARAQLSSNPDEAREHLKEAERLSRQSQEELALLIQELRPTTIQDQGLVRVLNRYISDWSRQTAIKAKLDISELNSVPNNIEQVLFRISQEALSNVARHSGAENVFVSLGVHLGMVTLSVRDDGKGFNPSAESSGGYGFQSMKERVENVSGSFFIESGLGGGTKVLAKIPTNVSDD